MLSARTGAAIGRNLTDKVKHQVFGRHAGVQLPVDLQFERLWEALQQRLCGKHVLDLAGADAERQSPKRAMGRSMAVAANDGHPRLRVAQLGTDDMDNTLLRVVQVVVLDAKLLAIVAKRIDLFFRDQVENRQAAIGRRHIVVSRCNSSLSPPNRTTSQP